MKFLFFKSKKSQKKVETKSSKQDKRRTVAEINATPIMTTRGVEMTHSPAHSISSASTQSSIHTLHQQETRGIFRTLEPMWSYLPDNHDQWVPLDNDSQRELEHAYLQHQPASVVSLKPPHAAPISAKVYFAAPSSSSPAPKKRRPVTQFFSSPSLSASPSTKHPQQMKSSPNLAVRPPTQSTPGAGKVPPLPASSASSSLNTPALSPSSSPSSSAPGSPLLSSSTLPENKVLHLYLHKNLRRALVPRWWFEQDNEHGQKCMCRFDYKNQVRLEALSDGRSTLTLTDASFSAPFQVMLEPADRSSREECRGFMYLNTPPIIQQQYQHPTLLFTEPSSTKHLVTHPAIYNDQEDEIYRDAFLNRRCSI